MDVDPRGKVIDAPLVSDGTTVQHNSIEVEPSEMARSWIKASLTHANLLTLRPDLKFR